ncbi:MAG: hypothetical protein Q4P14_00970 [Methanobacteriaceae archaeon]|nr:hypothetical protein [Methanobacteriaceae archaeon]
MNRYKKNLENGILDEGFGYGDAGNAVHRSHLRKLSLDDQKKYIKKLWLEDPESYYEFKDESIYDGDFPNLFGTLDNPIHIDESKL